MSGIDRAPGDAVDVSGMPEKVAAPQASWEERANRGECLSACHDCGIDAWWFRDFNGQIVHEDFYVHDALWDAACPDDDVLRWHEAGVNFGEGQWVLCIGCFEQRLGRTLTRADFKVGPRSLFGTPPSLRFRLRYKARRRPATEPPDRSP
jgi:hypothetical protein